MPPELGPSSTSLPPMPKGLALVPATRKGEPVVRIVRRHRFVTAAVLGGAAVTAAMGMPILGGGISGALLLVAASQGIETTLELTADTIDGVALADIEGCDVVGILSREVHLRRRRRGIKRIWTGSDGHCRWIVQLVREACVHGSVAIVLPQARVLRSRLPR